MNAPDKITELKAVFSGIAALILALLGWMGVAVLILLACMALDYITGSLAAKARGEWSSTIAREGLWHKLGEIAALTVAALCDFAVQTILAASPVHILDGAVSWQGYATLIVCAWYTFTELGSILENAAKLGAPVPKWLTSGLEKLKNKVDEDAEKE